MGSTYQKIFLTMVAFRQTPGWVGNRVRCISTPATAVVAFEASRTERESLASSGKETEVESHR